MPTRSEMIEALKAQSQTIEKPSREQMISALKSHREPEQEKKSGVMDKVIAAGKFIDSYTAAPARAAISAVQNDENPLKAFGSQFGENSDNAPTGKQIAQKAGVSNKSLSDVAPKMFTDNPDEAASGWRDFLNPISNKPFLKGGAADISASGAAGLGIDLLADPTNIIPVGSIVKAGAKGLGAGAKGLAKSASVAADFASQGAKKIPGAQTIGTVVDIAKDSAKNTSTALKTMFTPRIADDAKELFEIAKKNGIDPKLLPESIEFGENSFVSRAARNRAEGVVGETHLKKFQAGLEAVQDATEKKIAKISGGSIPSNMEAGELIRSGYDDAVDELFNNVDFTYSSVVDQSPGIRLTEDSASKIASKLGGIEKFAKGQSVRGITNTEKGQAAQLLRAVEAVKATNGSLKQLSEAMTQIGKHAFKKGQNALSDIPVDQKKFQEMYFTMRDEFINSTAAQLGDDVAKGLIDSNQLITNFNKEKDFVSHIIGNKNVSPEKVFASLIEHGDTQKINALKNILPQETFQRLKGSFLASQIKRNADGTFTFKSFNNNLRNKKNVLGALLSPEEINELSEITRLGDRFGSPVLSTSGTGGSKLFSNITEGIRSGVENDTVIDLIKSSARNKANKAADAAKTVTEIPKKQIGASTFVNQNKNFKRLASASPAAARALSIQSNQKEKERGAPSELKGESKWAQDGFNKLLEMDSSLDKEIMQSPKAKQLLIQASDLKPGSKAMDNILMQLKKMKGANKS